MSKAIKKDKVQVERKEVGIEVRDNDRGRFVILQEFTNGRYSEIRFPYCGLRDVVNMIDNVMNQIEMEGKQ